MQTLVAVWPDLAIYWTFGNFLKHLATINLPRSPTFLGIFVKFSCEIIFRQLLWRFVDFFWSHWLKLITWLEQFNHTGYGDWYVAHQEMKKDSKILGREEASFFNFNNFWMNVSKCRYQRGNNAFSYQTISNANRRCFYEINQSLDY